jgi:regulator of RNase E activity RraA
MSAVAVKPGTERVSPDVIKRYKKLSSATIWSVGVRFGINNFTGVVRPISREMKLCGQAVTMRLVPIQDTHNYSKVGSKDFEHTIHVLSRMTRPGDIHVLDMGGYMGGSLFGGHAATDAKQAGAGGIVIDGVSRDSEQQIAAGFPVFSRGTIAPHAHGKFRTANLNNEPVVVGEISIGPGDLVYGDMDGLCVVPIDRIEEFLPICEEFEARDAEHVAYWEKGIDHGSKEGGHHQNSLDEMDPSMITNVPKEARDPRVNKKP